MHPGIQAEASDPLDDLAEKLQGEMNIWLSSQPEFTDQQLRVTAMFGSHSENAAGVQLFTFVLFHSGGFNNESDHYFGVWRIHI